MNKQKSLNIFLSFSGEVYSDWKQDYVMVNFPINGANMNQSMLNNQGKIVVTFDISTYVDMWYLYHKKN